MKTFDELWAESQAKMAEYIATRTTPETRSEAEYNLGTMNMNQNYYRHRHEKDPGSVVICKFCGKMDSDNYTKPTGPYILEHSVCLGHALWTQRAAYHQANPRALIVNGHMYSDGGESREQSQYLGHGGRRFHIRCLSGDVFTTNNLWFGGCIPEEFRDRMPNNAEFLTKEQYEEAK